MSLNKADFYRTRAYKLLYLQLLILVSLALVGGVFRGFTFVYSLLLGGGVILIPNLIFIRQLFKEPWARAVKRTMRRMYWGELIKLILVGVLTVIVIRWFRISVLAFLLGIVVGQLAFWLSPLVLKTREKLGKV